MTAACWIGVASIALLFALALLGVKVCYSMLASSIVGLLLLSGLKGSMAVVSTALFSMVSSYDYAVLPMFILMATVITETGMGTSLYASCRTWLGHLPGGLCLGDDHRLRGIRGGDRVPLGLHHGGGRYRAAGDGPISLQ